MAEITAKLVKRIAWKSKLVSDAKKALVEVEGYRKDRIASRKGIQAAKKADRVAAEGLTGVYVNGTQQ